MSGGPSFTRRVLLGAGVAGGALLGAAGGLLGLRGAAEAPAGLRVLGAQEHRTVAKLAAALFPSGGAFALGAGDGTALARAFDEFLADEPEWNRDELRGALLLLEYGPVLFERRLVTFSNLDEEARLEHFERWRCSESTMRRQAATALARFSSLVFYDQPEVWGSIGYEGPMIRDPEAR